MENISRRILILFITLYSFKTSSAQYCVPVPGTNGAWINQVDFTSLPSGVNHNSVSFFQSEGYANRSATSSGNISANCPASFSINLQSCGNRGAINYNLRVFADWNRDNDFDDANEILVDIDGSMPNGNCAFAYHPPTFTPPAGATAGNIRIRCAVREGGVTATACGTYLGEVEDYMLMLAGNQAPMLNSAGTPFVNSLITSQTSNNGFSIDKIISASISDSDLCNPQKGIAIVDAAATNGTWQYKIGTGGAWTSIVAASISNALLLPDTCRMRFLPTAAGTSRFIFKAWDKSAGAINQYYNITVQGGTSAFSVNSDTVPLATYSLSETVSDIKVYMPTAYSPQGIHNIYTSSLSRASGILKEPENIGPDNLNGYGNDIVIDQVNNKLVWIGGELGTGILRSNFDGTGIEVLKNDFIYPTGVAIGNNKLFVIDYGVGIYSMNANGTGLTPLFGGTGQANDIYGSGDLEFYNDKLYYVNQPEEEAFKIMRANLDGTASTELYSTGATIYGLDVVNERLYWIEYTSTESMIRSMALTGGAITTIATGDDQQWFDLFVDDSGAKIYFLEPEELGNPPTLKSVPIAGGPISKRLVFDNTFTSLVFERPLVSLPLKFVDVKAQVKPTGIQVNWTVASEEANCTYTIERSLDGINYSQAGKMPGQQKSNYAWIDDYVLNGFVYYRIKATNADGKLLYSAVVKLSLSPNRGMAIFPTKVTNRNLFLRLDNQPKGLYQVSMYNANGQVVFRKQVQHSGGSSINSIVLPTTIHGGFYSIIVSSGSGIVSHRVVIE